MPSPVILPSPRFQLLEVWRTIAKFPGGKWLFGQAVCWKAPYFGSIHPTVEVLQPRRCEVRGPDRRDCRNHLGTYHAIAACNLAELAAGLMTDVTIPGTHRWIPVGMTVEYLSAASGEVRAVAAFDGIVDFGDQPITLVVPVEVRTADGMTAVRADISMHVSPRKRRRRPENIAAVSVVSTGKGSGR